MSKSGSFTVVLTVICLSVLMSEADAQSTTDETNSCSSSSMDEVVNLVDRIASVQQEIKEQLAGNSSLLKEVADEVKRIASNQEEIAKLLNASKSCESEAEKSSLKTSACLSTCQ